MSEPKEIIEALKEKLMDTAERCEHCDAVDSQVLHTIRGIIELQGEIIKVMENVYER